jgi:Putative auto-transporter adhesin, head GIN domain
VAGASAAGGGRAYRRVMPVPRPLLLTPLLAVALGGCAIGDDGPAVTQTRHVAGFARVDDRASVDVRLHAGAPRSVRVMAGEKVIDDVRTEVRDGTLRVSFDHSGWGGNDVVVEASTPKLIGIDASGSGDVAADGVDAGALDVRSDGSADIVLEGAARRLELELDGSGDADLSRLTAREARVSVGGSGDADVRADGRLDVAVDGSGDVRYHGHPQLTQRVDGGDVSRGD